ncbi:phosphotransferase family protein [Marinivivus vitaminiproducens]|uniref:phosphotransferase family protein n=1 Tax=Marinivivus vitaminiproducens TaxID=3035935 RepID=UPI002798AB7E|nr:aminoglycoside phosphotransferase family protein [Geminicoccaceae bacterium SCSIO 64248]
MRSAVDWATLILGAGPAFEVKTTEPQSEIPTTAIIDSLRGLGLIDALADVCLRPLTGGVSSDILLVETGGRRFCVKRALPRLKVAALWEAPVGRNSAEALWLGTVATWLPDCVPAVLGQDEAAGVLAMAYLEPERFPVWKAELLAGRTDAAFAGVVGDRLGIIHSKSTKRSDLAAAFANDTTFEAIRLEPYLRATGARHADLAARLNGLADRTAATRLAMVHGDVSPKNILHGPEEPVFLDAECAWWGDPAFDLAFCLNHFLLKAIHRPADREGYLACFASMAGAYRRHVDWEDPAALDARTASLLPALLLARVDGKSPVEYLVDEAKQQAVRMAARHLLQHPVDAPMAILPLWEQLT